MFTNNSNGGQNICLSLKAVCQVLNPVLGGFHLLSNMNIFLGDLNSLFRICPYRRDYWNKPHYIGRQNYRVHFSKDTSKEFEF